MGQDLISERSSIKRFFTKRSLYTRQDFEYNCYLYGLQITTFTQCRSDCASLSATMLCIQNADQDNFITSSTNSIYTWIGYTDEVTEGIWLWVDGCESTYTHWYSDEPNNGNGGGDEDYAVTNWNWGWNDFSDNVNCACQKPALEIMPTTKPTSTETTTTVGNNLLNTSGRLSYI